MEILNPFEIKSTSNDILQMVNSDFFKENELSIMTFICAFKHIDVFPTELLKYIIYMWKNTEIHWRLVALWKGFMPGSMDNHLKNHKINPVQKLITKFHSTININHHDITPLKRSYRFTSMANSKYVYKNLRFSSTDQSMIKNCELRIGDQLIDNVYGKTFPILRHLYKISDNTVIPFSFCRDNEYIMHTVFHKIDINIDFNFEYKNDLHLFVDIYEICDPDYNPDFIYSDIMTYQQLIGKKNLARDEKILINFDHIINYIIIDTLGEKLIDFKLLFNGIDTNIVISDIFRYDDMYIIPLNKSLNVEYFDKYGINFSRIDFAELILDIDGKNNENNVNIFAISYNEIRSAPSIGCGLMFN